MHFFTDMAASKNFEKENAVPAKKIGPNGLES